LKTVNTATNTEFGTLTKNLKLNLRAIKTHLNDLDRTITIVENNRMKFRQITDDELRNRKGFVAEMISLTNQCDETLSSQSTRNRFERDSRGSLLRESKSLSPGRTVPSSPFNQAIETSTDTYIDNKKQQQVTVQQEQDVVLDDIKEALGRLGDVSVTIGQELKTQEVLLDEVDSEVDDATNSIQRANRQLDKLLGKSDKGRYCCIVILIVLVLVLLIVIIYG